jgi:lysyl-tRNA synthetase class 2
LADALATVDVTWSDAPEEVAPGDLLVVRGIVRRQRGQVSLVEAVVLDRCAAPPSTGTGEFARFAWHGIGRRLRARAQAFATVRAYFDRRGFVEVDTPQRVPSPGSDPNVEAIPSGELYLITSPEHHMKRLLAGGLPRIYQIAHCHRGEELGTLHESEFSMLEFYRAFADMAHVMGDTEELVARVVRALSGKKQVALETGERVSVTPPFERLTVREAFRRYAGVPDAVELALQDQTRYFELFVSQLEPALASHRRPVFLTDYPLSEAALARPSPQDPSVCERFELYLAGVELCNGYGELTDAAELERRIAAERRRRRASGARAYPADRALVAALREGLPPCAGNALGLDRLIALALGEREIARVIAFPQRVH